MALSQTICRSPFRSYCCLHRQSRLTQRFSIDTRMCKNEFDVNLSFTSCAPFVFFRASSKSTDSIVSYVDPERRNGSNILPSIPPEIYFEIFDYFEPSDYGLSEQESKRYFIILSQVSCWFHSYFFPLIFRSLDVSAYRSSVSTDTRLFQELDNTASPSHSQAVELAALVTECTIRIYADDQEVYMRSLKHFSSLRYLSMIDIYISGYFVESLSHLQNLETLIITRCFLSKYPTDSIFNILLPKLTSFELSYSHPALPSNLFQLVLPNLASLKLQSNLCDTLPTSLFQLLSSASQTVKSLHITSFHAAVPVTLNHVYCFLTELVLFVRPVWGTPTFGNFLKQTPTITSINFIDDPPPLPSPPLPSFGLPLSTLPSLKHIRGPDWVLMDLIPGRSVKRVELFTFNFFLFPPSCFERAVDILCCSAAGIEHLEIPLSPVVPRGIFQNVRTLSLQLNDNLKDIKPNVSCPHLFLPLSGANH